MSPSEVERLISQMLSQHGGALRLFASTWTNSPDDCVQHALIQLAKQETPPDNPMTWLYRVVRNHAISQGKGEQRRLRRERKAAKTESRFCDEVSGQIEADEMSKAVESLPKEIREVVVAKIWGDLTFEQIAPLAKCSQSTAHRRYQDGIERLRKQLVNEQESLKTK